MGPVARKTVDRKDALSVLAIAAVLLAGCTGDQDGERDTDGRVARAVRSYVTDQRAAIAGDSVAIWWNIYRQKCSDAVVDAHKSTIRSICQQAVPEDGYVWIEQGEGECWCECEELTRLTLLEIRALSVARSKADWLRFLEVIDSTNLNSAMIRKKAPEFDSLPDNPPPPSTGMIESTMDTMMAMTSYPIFISSFKELYTRWLMARFMEKYPFLEYDMSGTDDFPMSVNTWRVPRTWRPGDPIDPNSQMMRIEFPLDFIRHPAVGIELIAFMIAHEVGHALARQSMCSSAASNPLIAFEGSCDHWGTLIALRRVFDGREALNISRLGGAQMVAYYKALWPADPQHSQEGICPDNPSNGYPPLDCRLHSMKAGRTLEPTPDCVYHWADH